MRSAEEGTNEALHRDEGSHVRPQPRPPIAVLLPLPGAWAAMPPDASGSSRHTLSSSLFSKLPSPPAEGGQAHPHGPRGDGHPDALPKGAAQPLRGRPHDRHHYIVGSRVRTPVVRRHDGRVRNPDLLGALARKPPNDSSRWLAN